MNSPRSVLALCAGLLLLVPAPVGAMTCSINAVVAVAFGPYDVFSASPRDSTGSVTYLCTGGPAGTITVDLGTGSSSSYTARVLSSGADSLSYNLYTSAAHASIWGDGTGGTSHHGPVTAVLDSETTVTIYGRIGAQQNVPAGSYADTVTVTITY